MGKSAYGLWSWVIIVAFLIAIGFAVVTMWSTPYFKPYVIFVPLILATVYYMGHYEYGLITHNKRFFWKTGVYGTLHEPINFNISGPRFIARVWINTGVYNNLPDRDNITLIEDPGLQFQGMLNRSVLIEFIGEKSFLPLIQSELKEGHYYYMGSLSGFSVDTEAEYLEMQLRKKDYTISKITTEAERILNMAIDLVKVKDKGLIHGSKQLNIIEKEAGEAKRNLRLVTNQGGGGVGNMPPTM